jgi:hypothetical protein
MKTTCADPTCNSGIDVSTPDRRFCWECGGHSTDDDDPPRGQMSIVDSAALLTIAATQVATLTMKIADWRRSREPVETPRDKHPTVYMPLGCGIATTFAGMTDSCARRRGHNGRCMSESEIDHIAEHGVTSVVEPMIDRAGLVADLAALSRHVEACPASLLDDDHTETEVAWVAGVRLRVESMVSGETFSDDTRV